jgi:hypothetical protein
MTLILVTSSACGAKSIASSSATIDPNASLSFSNFGNISARLFGLADFEGYGQTVTQSIEYSIPPISVTWMGAIFNGTLSGAGPGSDITYKVHGSLSDDGAWIESMFFSKQINGVYFLVTLKNVPLTQTLDDQGKEQAVFNISGPDVQKFLVNVQYVADPNFTYLTTSWDDASCVADLTLTLAAGPGTQAGDGKYTPTPGM